MLSSIKITDFSTSLGRAHKSITFINLLRIISPKVDIRQNIEHELRALLKLAASVELKLEVPPDQKLGDFAVPCFQFSKLLKKDPTKIADELKLKLKDKIKGISELKVVGPYLNFYVDDTKVTKELLEKVSKEKKKYGIHKKQKRLTYLMDVFQPNTHKAFHIGHIRNAVLGETIRQLIIANGDKAIALSYMGDVGAHVAKWLWYFKKFYKGSIPKVNICKWSGEIYTAATKISEGSEEYQKEIQDVHVKLENGDKALVKLWKKTRKLCLDDFWKIQKQLGIHLDCHMYESEVEKPGKKIVQALLDKGIAVESEGAIGLDLKSQGLGFFLLLKQNGASLYSTKDFGLAELKNKSYKFDKSLYIVAAEQNFYFQQLFAALKLINHPTADKNIHVSYGLVMLKEGKMSSREGNIVLYEDLRDQMFNKAMEEVCKRHESWDEKRKKASAHNVAFGAMKFGMLKFDNIKPIIFDIQESLDFEGETGPYVQYAHARICSIIKKAKENKLKPAVKIDFSLLKDESEHKLITLLANFSATIAASAEHYKPSTLCRYLLDLAQAFNEFYHKCIVVDENSLELSKARLLLVDCARIVLENGLDLLGIEAPDEM